jgi:ATP-dependent helicase/nuclease subunit B
VRSFVGMVERDLPDWEATELRFGFDDAAVPPVEIPLPSGRSIKVRGAIDRVDALPSGGLRVVDYKTGSPTPYSTATVWNEGRRLQHLIYTEVAERVLGRPVDRMEYHFPTRKGQNSRSHFTRAELREGLALIDRMLDVVAAGHFVPTPSEGDCRWCDFKHVCRVSVGEYGKIESSLAAWAGRHLHADAFAEVQLVRLFRDRSARKR